MSEEPTEDIGKKYDTRPTIETVLERINAIGEELTAFRREMREFKEHVEIRLDRIESVASKTRSEFLELRADLREAKHLVS